MHLGQKYLPQPHLVPLPHFIPAPVTPHRACGSHFGIHSLSSYRYNHTSLNKLPIGTGSFPGHAQLGVRLKMKTPRLLSSFAAILWKCAHGHRGGFLVTPLQYDVSLQMHPHLLLTHLALEGSF